MISTVFLGTPEASVPTLHTAAALTTVRLVVTRPDKPRGRSGKARPAPVKEAAASLGIPVEQPSNRRELAELLSGVAPFDVGVVVAFGMILSPAALAIPVSGFTNIHFSVLPRWRGAAPVERAILSGDDTTGVTLMRMDEGLDTGPVLASVTTPIGTAETAGELTDRLANLGAELFGRYVTDPQWRSAVPVPQTETGATYAERIATAEANLAVDRPSVELLRAIRAYAPRPGARFGGGALKVWRAGPTELGHDTPGRLTIEGRRLCLGTADQPIELIEVQAPGGRRMDGAAWARGRHGDLGWLR